MTGIKIFQRLAAVFLVILTCPLFITSTTISNKRLCFDPECSEPISKAKTLMKYQPNVSGILGFNANVDVTVFSKSAGNRTDLWGVEINGERGYIPHKMIREYKVLKKNPTYEVSTEIPQQKTSPESDASKPSPISETIPENVTVDTENSVPDPEQISPSYEVIDGTTIPSNLNEDTPESSSYSTQVHSTPEPEEQPILSIHPNIVASTLSFVSHMFESATESTETLGTVNQKEEEKAEDKEDKDDLEKEEGEEDVESEQDNEVVDSFPKVEPELSTSKPQIGDHVSTETPVTEALPENVDAKLTEETPKPVVKVEDVPQEENVETNEDLESEKTEKVVDVVAPAEESEEPAKSVEGLETFSDQMLNKTEPEVETPPAEEIEDNSSNELNVEAEKVPDVEEFETDANNTQVPDNVPQKTEESSMEESAVAQTSINNTDSLLPKPEDSVSIEPLVMEEPTVEKEKENSMLGTEMLTEIASSEESVLSSQEENLVPVEETNATETSVSMSEEENSNVNLEDSVPVENVIEESIETPKIETEGTSNAYCDEDDSCPETESPASVPVLHDEEIYSEEENDFTKDDPTKNPRNFWEGVIYVSITAFTTLLFSLGYYYIENARRDGRLIRKINKLEKELMISTKECVILDDSLKSTSKMLTSIEDESFGSNEMVSSLKSNLEASKKMNADLEDQIATLEKELESASEAGLELERMLREVLSTNNEDNPLAKSVEDLQERLNAQQTANESVTSALNLKIKENDKFSASLKEMTKKLEQSQVQVYRLSEELKSEKGAKVHMEQNMSDQLQRLELKLRNVLDDKSLLRNQLKQKEQEVNELSRVVEQFHDNNLNFEKLYEVAHVKAESAQLLEERNELKMKLSEVEGAHQLLEEHVKIVEEQIAMFGEQCKQAEKEKKDAETRLEVLTNFFKEKEAQRQKEEAVWLEKQGEVSSTVERLQMLQNEIQNYKQQVEMLKREIMDQEKEYKNQIVSLETKAHEHWVMARQTERRLEESKSEASQLRNRLTLMEKNMNDGDSDAKLHRLEANGETSTPPSLFLGAESPSSPVMFAGAPGVPPPPPSYMYGPPFPPFLPPPPHGGPGLPPFDVGQRPPPLGGRLSSPPPMHLQPPNRGSPPPPLPHPFDRHRSPPPPPPHFPNDHIPPPPSLIPMPLGSHPWGEESLPHIRNSGFTSQHQREQRARNHKGSLQSSRESLEKLHHSGKV